MRSRSCPNPGRPLVVIAAAAMLCVLILTSAGLGQPQAVAAHEEGEVLYNGIQLPAQWPPRVEALTREPLPTPEYLLSPPEVIPIDVGRQLFVDDFLIERTTLKRTCHAAEYYEGNPVLKPDEEWESRDYSGGQYPIQPCAMPFSDGAFYDPQDGLFMMWYMGGYVGPTCYATSKDGISWEKPKLDVVPGTNIVLPVEWRDSSTVWLDLETSAPAQRYKLVQYVAGGVLTVHTSPDGIHWTEGINSGPTGDRTSMFYTPFRKMWVYSLREYLPPPGVGRCRRYWENADLIAGAKWEQGRPTMWVGADDADPIRPDYGTPPELYNLDCVGYESVLLGLFSIWSGQRGDRPKPNYVAVGFSRDGFHWYRPWREAFIPVSERFGDWNWGNVQSTGGCCLVVGDKLYFYVSGRAGVEGTRLSGVCSTGLAILRRDGFASMDETEGKERTLTTKPLQFSGKHLLVNVAAAEGELRVAVLDEDGKVVRPFSKSKCRPIRADTTRQKVEWEGGDDLSALAGKAVRVRFSLRSGSLYAFWVSPDASGASYGYVAAGGPGFTEARDTVGER